MRIKNFWILKDEDYPTCYNIYDDNKGGERVKYFAEDDKYNLKRAKEWVKNQLSINLN